jgi:predicted transcriptional regulator
MRETHQIKGRRAELGLTQQELAHRAQCSVAMVRWLEAGAAVEDSKVLARILDVLDGAEQNPESNGAAA